MEFHFFFKYYLIIFNTFLALSKCKEGKERFSKEEKKGIKRWKGGEVIDEFVYLVVPYFSRVTKVIKACSPLLLPAVDQPRNG